MKKEHTHAQSSRLSSIFFILVMLEESRLVTVCFWVRDGCQRKSRSKGTFKDVSKNTDLSWKQKAGRWIWRTCENSKKVGSQCYKCAMIVEKKRGKDSENLKQIIKSVITKCYSTIHDILNKKKPLFQLPNLVKNNCGGLSANTGWLMPLISLQKTEKQCFITKCSCYWPKMNEAIWLDLFLQAVGLVKWHLIT